jgi:multiple sugar transport system permease protein
VTAASVPAPSPYRGSLLARVTESPWLLLLPALIPVVLFSVVPLLQGIFLGFTDARAGRNVVTTITGIDNYLRLAGNSLFWNSFQIGIVWAVCVTALQYVLGLVLALLLNERIRARALVRTLVLVPWAMPPVVIAILWQLIYEPNAGLLNNLLTGIGLEDVTRPWLTDFGTALAAVIVVGVWAGLAQTTITLLAGLQGIPGELYEAAAVDAAGPRDRFRYVTWPQLLPVSEAIISLDLIWNFNSFGIVYVLTKGGPGTTTMLPPLFAYNESFRYGNFGYAASMGNAMVLLVVALFGAYAWLRRRRSSGAPVAAGAAA